jgi:hypothetical protein
VIELLGTLFTGILSGGATGLIGVCIQRYFDFKTASTNLEILKVNLAAATENLRIELASKERMAGREADVREAADRLEAHTREIDALERSYQASVNAAATERPWVSDNAQEKSPTVRILLAIADFARGIVRPAVTVYTLILLTSVFYWVKTLYDKVGQPLTAAEVHDLGTNCLGTIFYLATTTTVWWFGVRPSSPAKPKRVE